MTGYVRNKKGFTILETLFVAALTVMVIGAILSAWMFTSKTWTAESQHTRLRVNMMNAIETIKNDLRLSSLTYMSFYPSGGEPYEGISLPVAETDANGLFSLNVNGEVDWDKTVIYHLYDEGGGAKTLCRTVLNSRDNTLTDAERYTELADVVNNGQGSGDYTTDTGFLRDVEIFEISSLAPVVDFYDDSSDPVRAGKVVFGWAKLDDGDHTIRFEITGKNDLSSGHDIGVDTVMIEPAGIPREMEYYNSSFAPAGALTLSGGGVNRVYNSIWSNNNYLEFSNSGTGSYVEILDHYDLLRDSCFDNASLNDTSSAGEEARVELEVPEEDEAGDITWFAYAAAGDAQQDGRDGTMPGGVTPPVAIRTVVSGDSIDQQGDLVRVSFKSSSTDDLVIDSAYITKRDGASGSNGFANQDTSGREVEEYHRHQKLFFRDSSGNITQGITVPQGSTVWSVWTSFPLRKDSDYFISFNIKDSSSTESRYWVGTGGVDRTYYLAGSEYSTMAGVPDWSGEAPNASSDIFIVSNIDTWNDSGSVESQIYDTAVSSPAYNQIKWSETSPAGTEVLFKARSSSDEYMTGATDWNLISGSAANPHSLSIGSGRYVQFMGELSSEPFWEVSGGTISYENYVDDQVDNYPVTDFPESGGEPYITGMYSCWVDDVEIDWPGDERLCTVTGYIARKNSYGQAKVIIDGAELVKILSVHLKISRDIQGRVIAEENYVEVEPRNTGK